MQINTTEELQSEKAQKLISQLNIATTQGWETTAYIQSLIVIEILFSNRI